MFSVLLTDAVCYVRRAVRVRVLIIQPTERHDDFYHSLNLLIR